MKIYRYKVKIGKTYYIIGFQNDVLEKLFDYYKVPYERLEN